MTTGFLIDTNVISEGRKRTPDPKVSAFMEGIRLAAVFISVISLGELRKGAAMRRRSDVSHADQLDAWINGLEEGFAGRLLPIDKAVVRLWGELTASSTVPPVDALIAATALVHDLTLVTRNGRDFAATGADLVDPWQSGRQL